MQLLAEQQERFSRLEIFRLSETVGKHLTFDDETWQAMHDLESDIDQFC